MYNTDDFTNGGYANSATQIDDLVEAGNYREAIKVASNPSVMYSRLNGYTKGLMGYAIDRVLKKIANDLEKMNAGMGILEMKGQLEEMIASVSPNGNGKKG